MTTELISGASRSLVKSWFDETRRVTDALAAPLSAEDQTVQSMPDASPAKWHRAHTTWFFETFILSTMASNYAPYDPKYGFLFNSYYDAIGARHPRPERGLLTRPTANDITLYREHVNLAIGDLVDGCSDSVWDEIKPLMVLGINHEQQHQELLLMDILHAFSRNPTEPSYANPIPLAANEASALTWTKFSGGIHQIGQDVTPDTPFAYDNEGPRHDVIVQPFNLANRTVTNREWIEFINDKGYERPEFWLADGWACAQSEGWNAPLYWREDSPGDWSAFGLRGRHPVNLDTPVCHVSHYEADAFASWAGKRLPTETEWEIAASDKPIEGNLLPHGAYRPSVSTPSLGTGQLFGDVWEHTRSPYTPYPGFKAASGAVGEYNGKFMSNQMVLRGGSCVTPGSHLRKTYRNFFYPHQRWMFAGVRLVEDT